MTVHDTQVLVVGAGPTGLTAAIELLRQGVDCMLIDERSEPARYSRALVLQARSLELLQMHGLSDAFVREETVDAIVPYPLRIGSPQWITRFRAQNRLLTTYRNGRMFFVGDAAHLYIPVAAQGMNTGIQDAFNWKLSFVCRGRAPESLLDNYDEERHVIGERTRKLSDLLFHLFIKQARSASTGTRRCRRRSAPAGCRRARSTPATGCPTSTSPTAAASASACTT
ncbi:FAD-dependent monooxygenase [Nonomuraea sp. NPDC049695]|uniref:FAD-dependent monooxygenase n=1 Tax=Nonomuraea sp. NPDC049695 TaxID=3154734 RepID=UPI0034472244